MTTEIFQPSQKRTQGWIIIISILSFFLLTKTFAWMLNEISVAEFQYKINVEIGSFPIGLVFVLKWGHLISKFRCDPFAKSLKPYILCKRSKMCLRLFLLLNLISSDDLINKPTSQANKKRLVRFMSVIVKGRNSEIKFLRPTATRYAKKGSLIALSHATSMTIVVTEIVCDMKFNVWKVCLIL